MPRYDTTTALLVVDVQNDFADPAGSLSVAGGERLVPIINRQIERAREAGAVVVYTQDWHPETTPHFQKDGGIWPVHCVMDTWGAELHPQLRVVGDVIRKGSAGEDGYSAFSMRDPESGDEMPTGLEAMLRERGVRRVVICGLATDYCVNASAVDALQLGFETVVLLEAIAAVNMARGDAERALDTMAEAGAELARS
jgi:nicotinamidase/pyrazinamidase